MIRIYLIIQKTVLFLTFKLYLLVPFVLSGGDGLGICEEYWVSAEKERESQCI